MSYEVRVKICGMRSERDIQCAVSSGADALGFLVGLTHFSEDELDIEAAGALLRQVPPFVSTVLVTHLVEAQAVADLATTLGVDHIQIHGEMPREEVERLRARLPLPRLIKAIHVTASAEAGPEIEAALEHVRSYEMLVDALLLDSRTPDRLGGTGQTHNWSISKQLVQATYKPVILAGGLNPDNIRAAIEMVQPFAVDVNSGVEDATGSKDVRKCQNFVWRAKTPLSTQ